jgi:hypothetical protein
MEWFFLLRNLPSVSIAFFLAKSVSIAEVASMEAQPHDTEKNSQILPWA